MQSGANVIVSSCGFVVCAAAHINRNRTYIESSHSLHSRYIHIYILFRCVSHFVFCVAVLEFEFAGEVGGLENNTVYCESELCVARQAFARDCPQTPSVQSSGKRQPHRQRSSIRLRWNANPTANPSRLSFQKCRLFAFAYANNNETRVCPSPIYKPYYR